jgi:hypothetical protein
MATFTQPTNRAADLKAVMDGYEQAIQKNSWLSEAFQKDGIQNAWGARNTKTGKDWEAKLLYFKDPSTSKTFVMIEDSGTHGLTGDVPGSEREEINILESDDERQRLGRFLSSNWSMKTENSIGSRGRGKMIFIGASTTSEMYFETVKSDDKYYVFGRTYLDKDKTMKVEVQKGEYAHELREQVFGKSFPALRHIGTRIIVPEPIEEVAEAIKTGKIAESIQLTWWEILNKYQAKIYVGDFHNPELVEGSPWLPIEESGLEKRKSYTEIPIEPGSNLKIKRINLAYLKDKEIPINYQGIAIQRSGMNIQIMPTSKLLSEVPEGKVYGSIEFDRQLDDAMLEQEGAEHYSFTWNKNVAYKVKRELTKVINDFAREFKILNDERESASKDRKEAASAVQRELNEIAKSLGLRGMGFGTKIKPGPPPHPSDPDPIQISIPDFRTPNASGQVGTGQQVTGTYALASSEYSEQLKVSFQVWIYREGGFNLPGLLDIREGIIGQGVSPLRVGWDDIQIDERFEKGHYFLKAKLIALEDRIMDDGKKVEKGDILYREVSRPFWVDEEPPAKGFFKDIVAQPKGRERYVWWEYDDGYVLYYNNEHPQIKGIIDDDEAYKDLLRKEGALILWTIVLSNAFANPDDMDKKILKLTSGLEEQSIDTQVSWLLSRRSEILWGK